jgi:hypothetical protein
MIADDPGNQVAQVPTLPFDDIRDPGITSLYTSAPSSNKGRKMQASKSLPQSPPV